MSEHTWCLTRVLKDKYSISGEQICPAIQTALTYFGKKIFIDSAPSEMMISSFCLKHEVRGYFEYLADMDCMFYSISYLFLTYKNCDEKDMQNFT
jgi:hypothetical protein